VKIKTYAEHDLGPALARQVAENLQAAIDTKGRASIAVPGGSTPGPFLSALSLEALDWEKVTVTLSDERCVPAGHARSNQTLVTKSLLRGAAQAARFIPLHADTFEKEDIETALTTHALPLDVSVLGMGNDLHTASLFPGTPRLADLLNPRGAGASHEHRRQKCCADPSRARKCAISSDLLRRVNEWWATNPSITQTARHRIERGTRHCKKHGHNSNHMRRG